MKVCVQGWEASAGSLSRLTFKTGEEENKTT